MTEEWDKTKKDLDVCSTQQLLKLQLVIIELLIDREAEYMS